ncbi:cyclic-di-AMP-binding protein CbpB [Bacillus sp. 2205SS5-2]|uniref:cyclic-di-AMP-binding protein CbpB n=1 Tax=Bacillus sp. 2205SS5-2 TaxID=3109031 RepID=UPI003007959F
MISLQNKELLETSIEKFIISSQKVAHVQLGNSIEHALLILTKSGYSAIPVLDARFHFHGLISSALITDSILGLERIEFEKLNEKKVEDVMKSEVPTIKIHTKFEQALTLLIDHPFLCVIDQEGYFEGILTRRSMLKELTRHVHFYKR